MKVLYLLLFVAILTHWAQAQSPYQMLQRAYAPYMSADDPLAFSMKVRSIAADPYRFWRGSKDLFFIWCKTNTTDWLADTKAFLPNHGDLHLGNIGSYACAGGWDKLAFGMVDFDDSAVLPFQVELLQGLITLKLTARQNNIAFDDEQLAKALFDSYRVAVNSQRTATAMLVDEQNKTVVKLLQRRSIDYSEELKEYTDNEKFRSVIISDKGKLKDILHPAMERAGEFATGIAQAIANEPDLKKILRFDNDDQVRAAIKDICQRTRLNSSGSQGLKKYLVLMNRPIRGADTDAVIYLKQEIPSAAERAGVIERSRFTPGQRVKQDMDRLTDPLPYINSWCDIGAESYWVSFKEPWSNELDPEDVKDLNDLLRTAHIWGTVAGATHRDQGRFEIILPKLTPALLSQLRQRADAFVAQLQGDFDGFKSDAHVAEQIARADAVLHAAEK